MKNIKRYIASIILAIVVFFTATIQELKAQTVPHTNGTTGSGWAPPGWTVLNATPDVSNQAFWAGSSSFPWRGTVALPPTGHNTWVDGFGDESCGTTITGLTIGASYTFTFYAAELRSNAGAFNEAAVNDNFDGVLRLYNSSTNATLTTYNFTGGPSNAWNTVTYTFTASATTLPITFMYLVNYGGNGNFWNVSFASNAVVMNICAAGTTAPTLSSTTRSNVCPASTVNLSSITASNTPAGASLTWHTGTPATTVNRLSSVTALAAGTYHAAFFDGTFNCYSTTTTNVTATVICCAGTNAPTLSSAIVSNVCPASTVNLSSVTASNTPAGASLTWHTGTPATTVNRLSSITGLAAGTYHAAFFDATQNCYSTTTTSVTATVLCCAGTNAPTLNSTSVSNVCPANTVNLSGITASNTPAGASLTWHTGTPATTVNRLSSVTALAAGTYHAAFFDATQNCYSTTTTSVTATVCCAGNSAPTLSSASVVNVCPANTVNLSSITASNMPAGTSMTWHTGTPATTANRISSITALAAGMYYAAFFDAANNCYSTTTSSVTATVICCAGTNAPSLSSTSVDNLCPATTVNLSSITASNMPAGASLTWHTGTPATTANRISSITALAAGMYYAAFFDATGDCYSTTTSSVAATVLNCCASAAQTLSK